MCLLFSGRFSATGLEQHQKGSQKRKCQNKKMFHDLLYGDKIPMFRIPNSTG